MPPALKTTSLTPQSLGARKAEIANASERRDALDTLVKAEDDRRERRRLDDRAFATVQKANPALSRRDAPTGDVNKLIHRGDAETRGEENQTGYPKTKLPE